MNGVTENTVVALWQKLSEAGCEMFTEDGQVAKVLYTGKLSDEPGGDFKDAVIEVGSRTLRGNIEIHTHSRDWPAHGHHRDAAYNGVVLHVVMWHDPGDVTFQENGGILPQIALAHYAAADVGHTDIFLESALPCARTLASENEIIGVMEKAGVERFLEKAAVFQTELEHTDAGECLYRGTMQALGYTKNKVPFLEIARAVPLKAIEAAIQNTVIPDEDIAVIQSRLLGTGGFLPSQRSEKGGIAAHDSDIEKLESLWRESNSPVVLSLEDWRFFKVRPGNHPVRRLAGMSYLVAAYRDSGLLPGLVAMVHGSTRENNMIQTRLMVPAAGYWTNHFDFGKACDGLSPYLIGSARASEMAVNVLLPFVYALEKESREKALDLFQSYPAASENTVEKHMREQLSLKRASINTACRQQGLLHIYKKFCIQGKCRECRVMRQLTNSK
jgi:hypothetical protein